MARRDHIVRLFAVAQALGAAGARGVPLKRLAERHGWPLRALYRDLQTLEAAGVPILKEGSRYLVMPGWIPALQIGVDTEELTALYIARQLTAGLRGTGVSTALDTLWSKLTTGPGRSGPLFPPGGAAALGVRGPSAIDYAAHRSTIRSLERALRERRAVRCRYHALSTNEVTERIVEPGQLHFDPALEALYLIAFCRLRQDVRVFAVHRFRALELLDEQVRRRPGLTSREALAHAFRAWRGSAVERVVIELSPRLAREVGERAWHPSQRFEPLASGGARLTLELGALEEIERWVLAFGGEAVVVAPEALRERVRRALEAGLAAYRRPAARAPARRRNGVV